MNKEAIIGKFNVLLDEIILDGDTDDMETSRAMFKKAVAMLANTDAKQAEEFLCCFEGTLKYFNYLSSSEASRIVDRLVNQDGSKGPKWRADEFFETVTNLGGELEHEPYYNKYALYVTANKFASDQHKVIVKWVGNDPAKYAEACYDLAVSQLEDKDKLNWVRWYFGISD